MVVIANCRRSELKNNIPSSSKDSLQFYPSEFPNFSISGAFGFGDWIPKKRKLFVNYTNKPIPHLCTS